MSREYWSTSLNLSYVTARNDTTVRARAKYTYDTGGRLGTVSDELATAYTATDAYHANSPLVDTLTISSRAQRPA